MIKKTNEDFYLKLNTVRDYYDNADKFSGVIIKESNNTETILGSFTELILSHESHSATATGNIGSYIVEVTNSTFVSGDIFKHNLSYYYIKEATASSLTLFTALNDNISGIISQVGNTGIYKSTVNLTESGNYSIVVSNAELFDSNKIVSIKVIDEDITDAHTKIDNMADTLNTLSDDRNYVAFV